MKDNRYDFEDVELLLAPKCEFHASEALKEKVTDRARAMTRPRRARIATWIAAACAAGLIIISLLPPQSDDNAVARKEPPADTIKTPAQEQPMPTADLRQENKMTAKAATTGEKKPAARRLASNIHDTVTICGQDGKHAEAEIREALGQTQAETCMAGDSTRRMITDADLPITTPENYEFTADEIRQIRRQIRKAYIARMRLEIEIARYNLDLTANI